MGVAIGLDTSCYTTSAACFSAEGPLFDGRKLLPVEKGSRGLRQSEGLFLHTRQLPPILESLFEQVEGKDVSAVGVSMSPVHAEDSYMPVFLAGAGQARALAAALRVPLVPLDHQSGHVRAALIGNEKLMDGEGFYAVHLSGGTSDLLLVKPHRDRAYEITLLGKADDLHAGQMVDRVGVALGCSFPSGPHLEELARQAVRKDIRIPASVRGLHCSFSGGESAARRLMERGEEKAEIAYGVYDLLSRTLYKLFTNLFAQQGARPILLCGGVSSSLLLRELVQCRCPMPLYFGESRYSSDNAMGIAALAYERMEAGVWN